MSDSVRPETTAHQAPPSLGFSRQEHWSGLPFPPPMHESEKWSRSVVSDSLRPHGLQPTRLLRPWGFTSKPMTSLFCKKYDYMCVCDTTISLVNLWPNKYSCVKFTSSFFTASLRGPDSPSFKWDLKDSYPIVFQWCQSSLTWFLNSLGLLLISHIRLIALL